MTGDKAHIKEALAAARERTWHLADGLSDEHLCTPVAPFLSPPVWDLGHMANFEELWLVQTLTGRGELHAGDNDTYDAIAHPRPERPRLPLLDRAGARAYQDEVRRWTLRVLDDADTSADAPRLTRDGFVHWMIVLHEHQHQETLLQTIQMRAGAYRPHTVRGLPAPPARVRARWCDVPDGPFTMGAPAGPGVYDNEAPPREVDLDRFRIASLPVTCGEHLDFIDAGGYEDPALWTQAGRAWLRAETHHAPLNWTWRDGAWWRRNIRGDARVTDVADEVLCHVTLHEAQAHAAWRAEQEDGIRLPSEAEWEKAARADAAGRAGRNPWGDAPATAALANVGHFAWGPARAGAFPGGSAPCGAQQMVGDVWEWTASVFTGHDGFEAFPYREYSEVFFDRGLHVLRGGSWATQPTCAHATFRNWDLPERRQIFAGVRLAMDA